MKITMMNLTEEELALIARHRSKGTKLEKLIENRLKEFPTLKQFIKAVGITMEEMKKLSPSFLNERFIALDVKTNKLKAYLQRQVKSSQKGIYRITEEYSVSGIKTFVKQKLIQPTDLRITVIDNRVVSISTDFYRDSIYDIYHDTLNIQDILPDFKHNLIQKAKLYTYKEICRLENSLENAKNVYVNYLLTRTRVKEDLGKEYETLKNEFANS